MSTMQERETPRVQSEVFNPLDQRGMYRDVIRSQRQTLKRKLGVLGSALILTTASFGAIADKARVRGSEESSPSPITSFEPSISQDSTTLPEAVSYIPAIKSEEFWSQVHEDKTEIKSASQILADLELAYADNPTAEEILPLEEAKEALSIGETGNLNATPNDPENALDEKTVLSNRLAGYYIFVKELLDKVHANTGDERVYDAAKDATRRALSTIEGFDFERYSKEDLFALTIVSGVYFHTFKDPRSR